MKNLIPLIIIGLIFTSCDTRYSGNLDIEGYLMYECGNTDPLGGTTLTFSIDGTDLLTTKTQSNGYFHFKGAYDHKSRSEGVKLIGWSFNGQNGGGFGSIDLISFFPDKLNADTIYKNNFTNSIIRIEALNGNIGSQLDTLYVWYNFNDKESDKYPSKFKTGYYNKKYAGPFVNGQIIDTAITLVYPHVGYKSNRSGGQEGYAGSFFINDFQSWNGNNANNESNAEYPFVHGQSNIACGQYTDVYIKLD